MQTIVVTGAAGFIGRRLVESLSSRNDVHLRLLTRRPEVPPEFKKPNVTTVQGDLLVPETLAHLFQPGSVVVNLAYDHYGSRDDHVTAIANLMEACSAANVKRLIHCSTAVVAGRISQPVIDENTPCHPRNEYESIKLELEQMLRRLSRDNFDLAILRPTAVFGPGGRNLKKLADEISQGSRIRNYLKSSFYGRRSMNAVCLGNVVSAIEFLIDAPDDFAGEIFIVSDDEHPGNNYRDIETFLRKRFGRRDYPIPRLPLPKFLLGFCLRLAGRSNVNPAGRYDGAKLLGAGYRKPVHFEAGLEDFAEWYRNRELQSEESAFQQNQSPAPARAGG